MSFLKAMYGHAATKENDWAFHYLPKIDRNYSWVEIWNDMYEGKVKGIFAFGMNGVMIGPDSQKNIDALKKADWLVVCEIYPDETSEFWRAPGTTPEEMKKINTTVYRLPGAGFAEKDGTFVNSARWLQWKNVAVPPPGMAKLDQEILAHIFLKVRELYKKEGGKFPDPILNACVDRTRIPTTRRSRRSRRRSTARRSPTSRDPKTNQTIKAGQQLPGFAWLRDDGTTLSAQLALLRIVDRSGCHDAAPRHRRSVRPGHLSQLGVVVAGEPPRAVQPRLVRPRRQALGSATAGRSGGTKASRSGWATTFPTSKPTRSPKITWARSS